VRYQLLHTADHITPRGQPRLDSFLDQRVLVFDHQREYAEPELVVCGGVDDAVDSASSGGLMARCGQSGHGIAMTAAYALTLRCRPHQARGGSTGCRVRWPIRPEVAWPTPRSGRCCSKDLVR
jgi:hypothetical protein